jgi:hypothetical protein
LPLRKTSKGRAGALSDEHWLAWIGCRHRLDKEEIMVRSRFSVITFAGAVLAAPLAGASPATAQAPCAQWDLSGWWLAIQTNAKVGFNMQQTGTELRGGAQASVTGFQSLQGSLDGVVHGDRISFTVYWSSGSVGVYSGKIDSTGTIEGTTRDNRSGAQASWYSTARMNCLAREAPPPAKKVDPNAPDVLKEDGGFSDALGTAPPPAQNVATVNGDVDLYDAPDGNGNVIGILRKGQKVTLAAPGCNAGTWCRITEGFVWGAFLIL